MPESNTRSQIGRIGAYISWANTENRTARTEPARRAMLDKFEHEVDLVKRICPMIRSIGTMTFRRSDGLECHAGKQSARHPTFRVMSSRI
ncbi:MAG: hypothetical protein JWP83_1288 [Mycobacterium sp.]|jgi:hypothetical protein|uniref:hypothetical protein n=1 Tax=Mycobacterium sp. TaxID=1785 RepID=UPI00262B1FC6|nr:hypothetical protein [Mycobacterium sp.]MCW2660136.1 hypothetical protein [Mycobacterium sp.]